MLTCMAVASILFYHIEHDEQRGVGMIATTTWEVILPVEGTTVRRDTGHDDKSNYYTVRFNTISKSGLSIRLDKEMFPNWSPLDLLESCDEVDR